METDSAKNWEHVSCFGERSEEVEQLTNFRRESDFDTLSSEQAMLGNRHKIVIVGSSKCLKWGVNHRVLWNVNNMFALLELQVPWQDTFRQFLMLGICQDSARIRRDLVLRLFRMCYNLIGRRNMSGFGQDVTGFCRNVWGYRFEDLLGFAWGS